MFFFSNNTILKYQFHVHILECELLFQVCSVGSDAEDWTEVEKWILVTLMNRHQLFNTSNQFKWYEQTWYY